MVYTKYPYIAEKQRRWCFNSGYSIAGKTNSFVDLLELEDCWVYVENGNQTKKFNCIGEEDGVIQLQLVGDDDSFYYAVLELTSTEFRVKGTKTVITTGCWYKDIPRRKWVVTNKSTGEPLTGPYYQELPNRNLAEGSFEKGLGGGDPFQFLNAFDRSGELRSSYKTADGKTIFDFCKDKMRFTADNGVTLTDIWLGRWENLNILRRFRVETPDAEKIGQREFVLTPYGWFETADGFPCTTCGLTVHSDEKKGSVTFYDQRQQLYITLQNDTEPVMTKLNGERVVLFQINNGEASKSHFVGGRIVRQFTVPKKGAYCEVLNGSGRPEWYFVNEKGQDAQSCNFVGENTESVKVKATVNDAVATLHIGEKSITCDGDDLYDGVWEKQNETFGWIQIE